MDKTSRFYSSLALLILLNVIIKPVWILGIDRQVQNVTGTDTYGLYFSLFNLSTVFNFLLDWGITNYLNRQLAAQEGSPRRYIASFLVAKVVFSLVYFAVVAGVAWVSGVTNWATLGLVLIIQFLFSLFLFLRGIVTGEQWFRAYAWISVLDKLFMIIFCGLVLLFPERYGTMTIRKFLLIQIGSTIGAILITVVFLRTKHYRVTFARGLMLNWSLVRAVLPFAALVFLMSTHNRMDGFLLERLHPNGAYEAGIYAASYRLLDASGMVGYLFASFLLPFIAREWANRGETKKVILQCRHLLLFFAIYIACISMEMAPWIQHLLYRHDSFYGAEVMQYCLPAIIGYCIVWIYGTIMTATGHIVSFCWLVIVAVVINIGLNLLLIPGYGAKGCAIAGLVSQLFLGIATMIYARRRLKVEIHYRSVLIYAACFAALLIVYQVAMQHHLNVWFLLVAGGVFFLIVIWVTKLFTLHSALLSLFKKQGDPRVS